MGEQITIVRRVSYRLSKRCLWCGNVKKIMYNYNGFGPYCDRSCATSHKAIPDDPSIPVHHVGREE